MWIVWDSTCIASHNHEGLYSEFNMSATNQTSVKEFFIVGFPGLHPMYFGLTSVLLFFVYMFTLVGNGIFLILFITDRSLHKPMYVIILNLVVSDVLFSTTTLPKIIA
ncbi:hypothetical protein Z043_125784, partial [Scleropages formosus]